MKKIDPVPATIGGTALLVLLACAIFCHAAVIPLLTGVFTYGHWLIKGDPS
jgi:hypothetical protein